MPEMFILASDLAALLGPSPHFWAVRNGYLKQNMTLLPGKKEPAYELCLLKVGQGWCLPRDEPFTIINLSGVEETSLPRGPGLWQTHACWS